MKKVLILLKQLNLNNNEPFFCFSPHILRKNVIQFKDKFPGRLIYSVKANPSKHVLKLMKNCGVNSFDAASIKEIETVYNVLDNVRIYFMNTVKSRCSIREAYFKYNIKDFSLDTLEELNKILEETLYAEDLNLHLRLSIPNNFSKINLSSKFGATVNEAKIILDKMRKISCKVGISFHAGSQCMNPKAYKTAIKISNEVIKENSAIIDYFNVGGGFPAKYPGSKILPLTEYFSVINKEFKNLGLPKKVKLMAEPGRCLVSDSMSLNVKVTLRKFNFLYINDGVHGSLYDAGVNKFKHSVNIINRKVSNKKLFPFSFYGPTCDSSDFMEGPFLLPNCIREGDWIQIHEMGAYAITMQSDFNGFFSKKKIFINK